MAKGGPLKFLLPAALGIGALATGGFGLPGLLGLGGEAAGAGADVGAAAGADALDFSGGAAGIGGAAGDVAATAPLSVGTGSEGALASSLLNAGDVAAPGATTALTGVTPLSAGSAALSSAPDLTALAAGTGEAAADPFAGLQLSSMADFSGGAAPLAGPTSGTLTPTPLTGGVSAAGAGAAPVTPVSAVGPPGGLPTDIASATDPIYVPGTDTLLPTDAQILSQGGLLPSGAPAPVGSNAAGSGGIFGTGVTGGDIFKDIGGLRGLTSLLSAGIMLPQVLKGPQQYPEQQTLGQQGAGYTATGNALQQPLSTGALPTGAESAVDLATAASKARISSTYANMGLSGSTMESEALNQADQQAAAQKFGIADQLLQQSLGFSSLGTDVTQGLLKTSIEEDQQYREALANFAKALAGTGTALPAA